MPKNLRKLVAAYKVVTGHSHQAAVHELRAHDSLTRSSLCCCKCPPDLDVWEPLTDEATASRSQDGFARVYTWPPYDQAGANWVGELFFRGDFPTFLEGFASAREAQLALVDERRRRAGCSCIAEHRTGKAFCYYEFARDRPDEARRAQNVLLARKLLDARWPGLDGPQTVAVR